MHGDQGGRPVREVTGKRPVAPRVGEGMVVRRILLRASDVVFFKGVVEASEGLAAVFAEGGGDLHIAAPADRASELDATLAEICAELGAVRLSVAVGNR
jgi:hypothetical protein